MPKYLFSKYVHLDHLPIVIISTDSNADKYNELLSRACGPFWILHTIEQTPTVDEICIPYTISLDRVTPVPDMNKQPRSIKAWKTLYEGTYTTQETKSTSTLRAQRPTMFVVGLLSTKYTKESNIEANLLSPTYRGFNIEMRINFKPWPLQRATKGTRQTSIRLDDCYLHCRVTKIPSETDKRRSTGTLYGIQNTYFEDEFVAIDKTTPTRLDRTQCLWRRWQPQIYT